MKALSLRHLCLIVFYFSQQFCILSHFEIIRCIVKSLVGISTYFFVVVELQLKKLGKFIGRQISGAQIGILVSQNGLNKSLIVLNALNLKNDQYQLKFVIVLFYWISCPFLLSSTHALIFWNKPWFSGYHYYQGGNSGKFL